MQPPYCRHVPPELAHVLHVLDMQLQTLMTKHSATIEILI